MFVEKYRPKNFENVVGLNSSISNVTKNGDIPHLLFYGSPGTGKTTTALIIVNELNADCLMLNASDERKIEVIRNKVKSFASTKSTNDKLKIVFLDEADALTPDAQNALRNMMETYYSNCRFILTGNTINKITSAIQSRCQKFKFELPSKKDIFNRLKFIVEQETINIKDEPLQLIIQNNYPDIRSCINKLDALHQEGVEITSELVNKNQMIVADLFRKLQSEKLSTIRQWILDNNTDYSQLTKDMSLYIWNNLKDIPNAVNILLQVGELNRYINYVVDQDIEFTDRLLQIKKLMNKK